MSKKIYYAKAVYDHKEINASINVLKKNSLSLMDGKKVKIFEKKVARLFGKKFGLMVNSGSSANLLALSSLGLKKNDEVITPTLTFSTTVSPIYQLGLKPKFIDIERNTYLADLDKLFKATTKKTKAIILPNLLGNVPDWVEIKKFYKNKNIHLIEDSADTIGYSIRGKNSGKFSDIVTTSFYASHIITGAGFGGMVCFNDSNQYLKAKVLRAWGRSSATFNEKEDLKNRFAKNNNMKTDYDKKYIFLDFGYNFIPSEISAAFALEQLKKLRSNFLLREKNFHYLKDVLYKHQNYFEIPKQSNLVRTCWLAFPILIKPNNFFKRKDLQIFLEKNNTQTRVIFSGNILRQPLMKGKKYLKTKDCDKESQRVMNNGILIGCHHGLKNSELNKIKKTINKFILNQKNGKN